MNDDDFIMISVNLNSTQETFKNSDHCRNCYEGIPFMNGCVGTVNTSLTFQVCIIYDDYDLDHDIKKLDSS